MPFTQKEWKEELTSQISTSYLPFFDDEFDDLDWEFQCDAKTGTAKIEKCKENFDAAADAISRLLERTYYK